MKELKFKTSKGNFILVEDEPKLTKFIPWDLCELVGIVKDMSEEDFEEIVDSPSNNHLECTYKDYQQNSETVYFFAKESFESLVKSLGWYLWENPVQHSIASLSDQEQAYRQLDADWQEAESKTLYSPILLKKV